VYVVLELQEQANRALVCAPKEEGRLYFYLTTLLVAYPLDQWFAAVRLQEIIFAIVLYVTTNDILQ
jgi:hypothetical protein